ncbi:MAG TPA: polyprenol phosphomannose-dependent alpha 1,6 mannosyltransferase MptB [Acidimicrobiales bacterium]
MTTATPAVLQKPAESAPRSLPLRVAGGAGFVGCTLVLLGVATRSSPFALKLPGAWFFGAPSNDGASATTSNAAFFGVILVYLGTGVMLASWFELLRTLKRHPDIRVKRLVPIFIGWCVPVVLMPPIFSHDVYVYAAQGQMVDSGINPYLHGPQSLGGGAFLALVDPIWKRSISSYGPVWERLSGWVVATSRHDVLASIVGFRLIALLGVVMIAWGVAELSRSSGRSGSVAFALAALNPLTLLILFGSSHNDALMVGLLILGCVATRRDHPFLGLVVCAIAAQIKIPAILGDVYIGWWWSTSVPEWRPRIERILAAGAICIVWIVAIGAGAELGWHWLKGLSNPGVVVSWLDPSTAVGLLLGHIAGAVGYAGHNGGFISAARIAGLCAAAVISLVLLLRSERSDPYFALGWSLLAIALLGPDIWPWYETWGIVVLAVTADRWTLRIVIALSAEACFTDFPTGELLRAPHELVTIVCWTALLGAAVLYGSLRLLPNRRRLPTRSG